MNIALCAGCYGPGTLTEAPPDVQARLIPRRIRFPPWLRRNLTLAERSVPLLRVECHNEACALPNKSHWVAYGDAEEAVSRWNALQYQRECAKRRLCKCHEEF